MRLLLTLILGFIGFFFVGELISRFTKKFNYSYIGLLLIPLGFWLGFWGQGFFFPPLNTYLSIFSLGAGAGLIAHRILSMRYIIAQEKEHRFLKRHETVIERICEIIPGALVWLALTAPFWLSITLPFAVAILLLIADAYWLLSSIRASILIFCRLQKNGMGQKTRMVEKT